jgi:signal transduction histidine kinase/DNA-binding NarL/FixJ family response regulator
VPTHFAPTKYLLWCTGALAGLRRWRTAPVLLAASAVVTFLFLALCVGLLFEARHDAVAAADRDADNIAALAAQDIARNIELYDLSLQGVAQALQLPGLDGYPPAVRQMLLFDHAANARYLGFINVLNEAGDVVADSHAVPPRSGNFAGRDYFQVQKHDPQDSLFIGRPFLTGPDQPATVPLSRRLTHPDGSFAGVVVGSLRLAYVRALFSQLALGPADSIALLRNDGLVLLRLPFAQDDIGRMLPAGAPWYRFAAGGSPRQTGTEPGDPEPRRYTFRRVGDLPLAIAVGRAERDIAAPWHARAVRILGAIAALCTLNLLLILLLRRALREQAQAEASARQAQTDNTRFLAAISHDLQTPLVGILGYADQLAADPGLSPQQGRLLGALTTAAAHMRDVIKQVLVMSGPDAFTAAPRRVDTDLVDLVAVCRCLVEPDAAAKGLHLSSWVEPGMPTRAVLDAVQVRQIVGNLLHNAVKYTTRGAIALRLSGDDRHLRFEIADTGPGIPARLRVRLFQAYDRLEAASGPIEGFGLGLSNAARLASGMGGRIGYTDNPGGGSLFWVEIPVEPPPPPLPAAPPATAPRRILLVDDEAICRDITAGQLRAAGHQVTEAADGAEAVRQAAAQAFDLVLMDMRMPGLSGLEACRAIRALDGARGTVPIVAVTADLSAPQQGGWQAAGITRYLGKPFRRAELLMAVAEAARGAPDPDPPVGPPFGPPFGRTAPDPTPADPPPAADAAIPPLLDPEVFEPLATRMPPAEVQAKLEDVADRIEILLTRLRDHAADAGGLAGLLHDMQGIGGALGLTALTTAIRQVRTAGADAAGARAELIGVAERSLQVLYYRLGRTGAETDGSLAMSC